MKFGTIEVAAYPGSTTTLEVEVNDDGLFTTMFMGEGHSAESLKELTWRMRDAVRAARLEVPFVSADSGRAGVIRGWHGSQREFLVTWEDGTKGKLNPFAPVLRPGDFPEADRLVLRDARERLVEAQRLVKAETPADPVLAQELFTEVFGEDVTVHPDRRKVVEVR